MLCILRFSCIEVLVLVALYKLAYLCRPWTSLAGTKCNLTLAKTKDTSLQESVKYNQDAAGAPSLSGLLRLNVDRRPPFPMHRFRTTSHAHFITFAALHVAKGLLTMSYNSGGRGRGRGRGGNQGGHGRGGGGYGVSHACNHDCETTSFWTSRSHCFHAHYRAEEDIRVAETMEGAVEEVEDVAVMVVAGEEVAVEVGVLKVSLLSIREQHFCRKR